MYYEYEQRMVLLILHNTYIISVMYDFKMSTLRVKIMKATDLPAKDFSGTSDPYVKVNMYMYTYIYSLCIIIYICVCELELE